MVIVFPISSGKLNLSSTCKLQFNGDLLAQGWHWLHSPKTANLNSMASVKSSRAKIYGTRTAVAEGEPPDHVPSEGEILIKQMVKKQMETDVTLDQQLTKSKEFAKAVEFESATKYFSGEATLQQFLDTSSKVEQKEILNTYGLTNNEIELLSDHNKGKDYFQLKYKNVEGSILDSELKRVHSKIQIAKAAKSSSEEEILHKKLSRHNQDLAKSVQHESEQSRLHQFALSNQTSTATDTRPPTHPINQLKDIEQELFGHLSKKTRLSKNKRRTRKKISTDIPSHELKCQATDKCQPNHPERRSLWDVTSTSSQPPPQKDNKDRIYSCKPETLYTIRDKKIVPLSLHSSASAAASKRTTEDDDMSGAAFVMSNVESTDNVVSLPTKQLTVDKIKELPRFANYDQGMPSSVLFIKNLHSRVREEDLVDLFKKYESCDKPRIIYRLMRGKMQGQAFVTFSDIATAVVAMNSINGSVLYGKPVIIQFGKSSL